MALHHPPRRLMVSLVRLAVACLSLVLIACGSEGGGDPGASDASSTTVESPTTEAVVTGSLEAVDQAGDGTRLTVDTATVQGAAGFVIVHREDKGGPGPVVGHAAIPEGSSRSVVVTLDEKVAPGPYWVMLHRDAGAVGTYEWPGPDGPVRGPVGLAYVQKKVVLTAG